MGEGYKVRIKKIVRSATRMFTEDPPAPPASITEADIPVHTEHPRWRKIGKTSLLILLFLVPLFFLPFTPAPVETGKTILALALLTVAAICFFAITIERRAISYPRSPIAVYALFLFGAVLVSTLFSKSWFVSLYGNLVKPDSVLSFLIYLLAFFLTFAFFDEDDMPKIALLFSGSILLESILAITGLLGLHLFPWNFAQTAGFTPAGSLYGSGILAGMLIVALAAAPFEKFSRRTAMILAAAGIIALIEFVILKSQLLWGILSFLMIVIAAARFVRHERFGLPLTIAIGSLFFTFINQYIPAIIAVPAEARLDFGTAITVAGGVLKSWSAFLGFGPAAFGYAYSLFRPIGTNVGAAWGIRFEQGHDIFTAMFVTTGILGLIALSALIAAFVRHVARNLDNAYAFAVGSTILFCAVSSFFYPIFFVGFFLIFFGLGLSVSLSSPRHEFSFGAFSRPKLFGVFIAAATVIAVSLAFFYIVGQKYAAAAQYKKGLDAIAAGTLPASLQNFQAAVMLDPLRDEYWRAASQALLLQSGNFFSQSTASPGDANLQAQALNTASAAITSARQATQVNPADGLNWDNLGSIYENLIPIASGADTVAVQSYTEALARDPKNPQEFVNIARTLITASDKLRAQGAGQKDWQAKLEDARPNLEKAVELKPDYAQAYFLLAQLYIREGNVARAIENTERIKAQNPFDTGVGFQLGILYYQNSEFGQARSEFERTIALDPNYSNARYFLGLIYDRNGRAQDAITQFKKIAELNPDNAEVKQILANLNAGRSALQNVSPPAQAPEKRSEVPISEKR